ncbi:chromate transporter [Chloroflexia bacterium SDU3-3]|nr:chromate transporter [Chloroflexia bacterium SDU3-3]
MIDPLLYFLILLKGSLFSTTGGGNLPIVHEDMIAQGWAGERDFAESLALGQISPGPSGFWVIAFGYLTYGLMGALLATAAIILPPMLVLLVNRIYQRIGGHPATAGFLRGLMLVAVGSMFVVVAGIMRTELNLPSLLIAASTIAVVARLKISPLPVLLAAGLAGVLLYR